MGIAFPVVRFHSKGECIMGRFGDATDRYVARSTRKEIEKYGYDAHVKAEQYEATYGGGRYDYENNAKLHVTALFAERDMNKRQQQAYSGELTYEKRVQDDLHDREHETGIYKPEAREYYARMYGFDPMTQPVDDAAAEGMSRMMDKMNDAALSDPDKSDNDYRAGGSEKTQTFVFTFEIDGIKCASFNDCKGLDVTSEILERNEGGENTRTLQFHGNVRYGNIILSKCVEPANDVLLAWLQTTAASAHARPSWKTCSLVMRNMSNMAPLARWDIYGAVPVRWNLPVGGNGANRSFSTDSHEILELAITRFESVRI